MYFESFNFENNRLNEGWFSKDNKNMKQNCLPIDITKKLPSGRVTCLNTHITNTMAQAKESKGILGVLFGFSIFSFLTTGTLAGLCVLLPTVYAAAGPLLRQYDARDFFLLPNNFYIEDPEMLNKLNENYFIKYPIVSINDGEVIHVYDKIRNGQKFDSFIHPAEGNHVIIKHYNGQFYSLYGHMYQHSMTVKLGDKVEKGQIIGYVGNTGNSSMPHLHFDMAYLDPRRFYSIGKALKNFEPYKYLPIDIDNQDTEYWKGVEKKKLIQNTSGILHDSCLLT